MTDLKTGCQNDTADVILVDPNGDQYECTDIPLEPDFTSELSTCPIEQEDMYSGIWSLLILSNNGNGDPIAYERDFTLTVGPQQTVTVSIASLPNTKLKADQSRPHLQYCSTRRRLKL